LRCGMDKDLLDLTCLSRCELTGLLDLADEVKANPRKYAESLKGRTLLMMFEKPSLRTRLSFEVGMTQLGGHAIYYDLSTSPMGRKESVADTARTASRYVDLIMARLFSHSQLVELAGNASVPVINALTDYSHPCQVLADLQTLRERKERLGGLKLAYLGDGNNNVTHSLLVGCPLAGVDVSVGCPKGRGYQPAKEVLEEARKIAVRLGSSVEVTHDAAEAVRGADAVYTDSWMSYHIPKSRKAERVKALKPFRVTAKIMSNAMGDAVFMHCLPAMRGMEVTAEVIDGPRSVVFDEAENRLHIQKALMLRLLGVA